MTTKKKNKRKWRVIFATYLSVKKKKICKDGRIEKDKTWRSDMKDSEEDSLSISTKIWFHSAQQMERGSSRRRHDRRHHHGEVGWRRRWLLYWISIFLFTVVAHNDIKKHDDFFFFKLTRVQTYEERTTIIRKETLFTFYRMLLVDTDSVVL